MSGMVGVQLGDQAGKQRMASEKPDMLRSEPAIGERREPPS